MRQNRCQPACWLRLGCTLGKNIKGSGVGGRQKSKPGVGDVRSLRICLRMREETEMERSSLGKNCSSGKCDHSGNIVLSSFQELGYLEHGQLDLGNSIDVNSLVWFLQIETRNTSLNLFLTAFCKSLRTQLCDTLDRK